MVKKPLISICIPSYNGGDYFRRTLASIIPYLSEEIELVISDDQSSDGTYEYALLERDKNPQIRVFRNNLNLGMDENFTVVARLAAGKYVWFCGQDDQLGLKVIKSVEDTLKSNNISILNINFSQYNHDMTTAILDSFFDRASFKKFKSLKSKKLIIFKTPAEYFSVFTQPPSFLPSIVMLKDYWNSDLVRIFYGTHFVQVGLILLNLHKGNIGALTEPLIKGRIPVDQWQVNGDHLISIMSGDILAKKLAYKINRNLPIYIYLRDLFKFTSNYPFLLLRCKSLGLSNPKKSLINLKKIYSPGIIYWIYIIPIILMPYEILRICLFPFAILKGLLLKFSIFERLRG